ncbi:hypothetical protein AAVH_00798 [Aphelenchoides avenae]|nr:hypothetical protein AAVH_00798 [Aphelenchus avenae]
MTTRLETPLLSLTPLVQSDDHNLVRVQRTNDIGDNIHLVAGGAYKGILINRLAPSYDELHNAIPVRFSVWIRDKLQLRQEIRLLRFAFFHEVPSNKQHEIAQQVFKDLLASFPKDYATFLKRILKMMQTELAELRAVDVDMRFAQEEDSIPMPDANEYESSSEIENVIVGHVQDVLEHAYPNGLSVDTMSEALRCNREQVEEFLIELEAMGIAARVPGHDDEWIRVDTFAQPSVNTVKDHPTVAIITCLFVEKQAIDALIDDVSTVHKYRTGGDSNVYTLGYIGKHRVVATKLSMVGDSREAITSAGSITTRLLGNFQHVEHVIVMGVGGGVPHYTDAELHIRLGDVVVSYRESANDNAYVYAHNFVVNRKTEQIEGFATREWNPKDSVLAEILKNRNGDFEKEWQNTANRLVGDLNSAATGNEFNFSRPAPETDILALPVGGGNVVVVPHPNEARTVPTVHMGSVGAMISLRRPASHD